ncbi:hypothetical protein QL285_048077 [Trifolium repens]|nr:hypothetical protein QL285_048077 [Trifolium repens]
MVSKIEKADALFREGGENQIMWSNEPDIDVLDYKDWKVTLSRRYHASKVCYWSNFNSGNAFGLRLGRLCNN